MKNPRITPKERGLLKGAIRRAFARSELRERVGKKNRISHHDPDRPRIKNWSFCDGCGQVVPDYSTAVDHIDPVIPLNSSFEEMEVGDVVDRTWCEESNLQVLCEPCHYFKTACERKERKVFKDAKDIAEGKVKVKKSGKRKSKKTT